MILDSYLTLWSNTGIKSMWHRLSQSVSFLPAHPINLCICELLQCSLLEFQGFALYDESYFWIFIFHCSWLKVKGECQINQFNVSDLVFIFLLWWKRWWNQIILPLLFLFRWMSMSCVERLLQRSDLGFTSSKVLLSKSHKICSWSNSTFK